MITTRSESCPYGVNDCPKVEKEVQQLEELIKQNQADIKDLTRITTKLDTTVRNTSFIITALVTLVTTIIQVVLK